MCFSSLPIFFSLSGLHFLRLEIYFRSSEWSSRNGKISKPLCESKFALLLLLNSSVKNYTFLFAILFFQVKHTLNRRHSLYILPPSALIPPSSWVLQVCLLNLFPSCTSFSSSKSISLGSSAFTFPHCIVWCIFIYHYLMLYEYCLPGPSVGQSHENKHIISFVAVSPVHRTVYRTWVLKLWLLK